MRVSRATTANYRTAVEKRTLTALPYSLSIDRSAKTDFIVSQDNNFKSHHVEGLGWVPDVPLTTVKTVWKQDWMSDSTTSFQQIQGLVDSQIGGYSNKRDNRLLKKLKGQSIPLLMAWREREETGRLLWAAANRISDACKVIRHPKQFVRRLYKNYKRPAHVKRMISTKVMERRAQKAYISFLRYKKWPPSRKPRVGDLFLQYEFAWKPLIMDIQDAMNATAETEKHLSGGSVKVGYKHSGTVTTRGGRMTGNELILKCDYNLYGHQKLYWSVDSVALAALSQIQSLPETLWDAMPYSFVVDWFINVGEYLELRNATLGLKFRNGYKSLCVEKRYTSKPAGQVVVNDNPYTAVTCWPERYQFSFQRQILKSFPDPHLVTDFTLPSSLTHMAEAAALVSQALHRKL